MKIIRKNKYVLPKVLLVFLIVYTLMMLTPIFWALLNSLKSYEEYSIMENILGLPKEVSLSTLFNNYKNAWTHGYAQAVENGKMMFYGIPQQFLNSLLYAGGCMVTSTLVPSVVAYLVARYDYKFSKVVYGMVIVAMILPLFNSMQSEILLTKKLGIFDTFLGVWLLKAHFLGSSFLIFYAQFKTISKEYTEAARIDGASHFATMTRVIFPLAKGSISTVALLNFVAFWNDYSVPMVYLPSHPVLAYGMFQFSQRSGAVLSSVPIKVSYMVVTVLPILVVFLLSHKKLLGNISIGGLKG